MTAQGLVARQCRCIPQGLFEIPVDGLALGAEVRHRPFGKEQALGRLGRQATSAFVGQTFDEGQTSGRFDLFAALGQHIIAILKCVEVGLGLVELGKHLLAGLGGPVALPLALANEFLRRLQANLGLGVLLLQQRQRTRGLLPGHRDAQQQGRRYGRDQQGDKSRRRDRSRHDGTLPAPLAETFPVADLSRTDGLSRQPAVQRILPPPDRADFDPVARRCRGRQLERETATLADDLLPAAATRVRLQSGQRTSCCRSVAGS